MSKATLVAHCGTSRVTEEQVRAEIQPVFTDTWHPFSHGQVLDAVGAAVKDAGFKVERREYSMSAGALMFGVWELNREDKELRYAIGLRNSINKKLSVGLCAGERVFVCDNLVFSSEFVLFRKHTGMLDGDELFIMAREAVAAVVPRWERVRAWHDHLKGVELNATQVSVLTFAAMRLGIISPSKFGEWNDLYFGNGDPTKYTPTLHGWHGATTELMNPLALHVNAAKQDQLNRFVDHQVPLLMAAAADKKFFTFDKVEERAADEGAKAKEKSKDEARERAADVRDKVLAARKEKKQAEKAAKPAKVKAPAKAKAAKGTKPKGEAKTQEPKVTLRLGMDGKLQRRTARVKVREALAKTAEPIKGTKVQKPPKGEKTVTAKTAVKKADLDPEDTFFCTDCSGEFGAKEIKRDRGSKGMDLVCPRCLEGREEGRRAGKAKTAK
jgi:hypothetical protein